MAAYNLNALLNDKRKFRHHLLLVVVLALILAGTVAVLFDQNVAQYFNTPEAHKFVRPAAREVTNVGLSEHYFTISLFAWLFCAFVAPRVQQLKKYAAKVDYFRCWGLNFLVALLVSGAMTHIVKFFVGRQRPHKSPTCDPFVFDHCTTHWHWHSFSSGHSQVMFTAAVMFTLAFPKFKWLWIAIAVFACATRVIIQDHFVSDTIFGATVGYVGTLLALKWMQKSKNALV
ncbi:phosphatase PAP2 family protein [Bdellovibrio sp. HCB274]|uniref:phosphatase PAP2 family protein n=1 Tax=Bdellovibrio sp. HCB274 TaxID=3394361 RepID=UPI0039B52DD4